MLMALNLLLALALFLCLSDKCVYRAEAVDSVEDGYHLEPAMLNYSHTNYTYHPSWFVRSLHHMPHFNEYARDEGGRTRFHGGNSEEATKYYNSLTGFPILMAILSVIVIVVLQLFLFGHLEDYGLQKPGPAPLSRDDETRAGIAFWTHHIETSRKFWVTLFLGSLTVVLVGAHIMFVGNVLMTDGIIYVDRGISDVESRVFYVHNDLDDIQEEIDFTDSFITASVIYPVS